MSVFKKLAAAPAAGDSLNVENVFSTYLYNGTGSAQTITNGIDLSGEGGLVWSKIRSGGGSHFLQHKTSHYLSSNTTTAETADARLVTQFNSDGYNLGIYGGVNGNGDEMVSWTFRKAPKFFDIVTYTGTSSTQAISHNLGSIPGMIIVKCTSGTGNWRVYHRGNHPSNPADYVLLLNGENEYSNNNSMWNDTAPTSTHFTVGGDDDVNDYGDTFVAYLFAHNNNDGGFGPDSDQDIIKCGSYTGNGSTTGPVIDLGFEPQWVMIKRVDTGNYSWFIFDAMRGMPVGGADKFLVFNSTAAEAGASERFNITPTGFQLKATGGSFNASSGTYIYMAIRRGPLAVPEDATKVFHVNNYSGNSNSNIHNTGFDVDMNINTKAASYTNYIIARLTGGQTLQTNVNNAAIDYSSGGIKWFDNKSNHIDLSTGWFTTHNDVISWSWKRAPSYFDVVTYSGTGSARTVSHNLGVVPEMMWVKRRDSGGGWGVWHKDLTSGYYLSNNTSDGEGSNSNVFTTTDPTATQFSVGSAGFTNNSSGTFIAYLFATLAGVSKVGSYTSTIDQYGYGTNQTIDCGFTNGARFVLIKRKDGTGDWIVFDSTRGITANTDPHLRLNNTNAEDSDSYVDIEPHSSGFIVNPNSVHVGGNSQGQTYIFYAIA